MFSRAKLASQMQARVLVLLDRPLTAVSATSLPLPPALHSRLQADVENDKRRPSMKSPRRVLGHCSMRREQTPLDLQRLSPP
ncbi:hypothetical protein K503DRAFT_868111 [Rhizopogon vinicolor AM-OR11-026]|uniref:Uncharacterized protein n=1 Tax=Rhizopogon vinicolor AM-OR11-026 TaxID=1314800 RepID=A0A1B7MSP7_9AGAM|nr:hypothetical protein K503DRAFT_868111 [Rhizopogon vinicolor AM-OR11-026]